MKGQHGVKVVTFIPCTNKDKETGEESHYKRAKTTTVFHISQTKPLDDGDRKPDTTETEAATVEPVAVNEAPAEVSAAVAVDAGEAVEAAADEYRPLNHYEAKQEAKRDRFLNLAHKASRESDSTFKRAHDMASVIPFGQPILVGHHSERRDRNYRGKIDNTFGKSFELQKKAEHYAQKADSVGTGGISSDDPDAIKKLSAEVAELEEKQAKMKAVNKTIRANKTPESQAAAIVALGYPQAVAVKLLEKDFCGRIGFADYQLTNNNANIRRIKARIAELEKLSSRADVEQEGNGYTYREDTAENRVMFIFDGKPAANVRDILKANSFKWSPSRAAWVRMLNGAGVWAGKDVIKALNAL